MQVCTKQMKEQSQSSGLNAMVDRPRQRNQAKLFEKMIKDHHAQNKLIKLIANKQTIWSGQHAVNKASHVPRSLSHRLDLMIICMVGSINRQSTTI